MLLYWNFSFWGNRVHADDVFGGGEALGVALAGVALALREYRASGYRYVDLPPILDAVCALCPVIRKLIETRRFLVVVRRRIAGLGLCHDDAVSDAPTE